MAASIVFGLLGLCFGSFVNAFVWRIKKKKNWVSDRSICTHCKHVLAAKDLMPVVSWLFLKGKCRYCNKAISVQYPIVELIGALAFVSSYIYWPHSLVSFPERTLFAGWLVIVVGLLALAVYDAKWMLLPNKILYPLTVFASALVLFSSLFGDGTNAIREAVLGVAVAFGFFYLLFQLSKGAWIGGGDVKLGVLIGLTVGGPAASALVLFMASLLGTVFIVPQLLLGKAKQNTKIPFGPFLIIGIFIVKLFGATIIYWYKHKVLLLD